MFMCFLRPKPKKLLLYIEINLGYILHIYMHICIKTYI